MIVFVYNRHLSKIGTFLFHGCYIRTIADKILTAFGATVNAEAFDLEIPEINCVYTHMMGHDCHSIVAGCPHADGIISQLNYYIRKGFDLVLTAHYTPEDLKDAQTKVDYLTNLKEIALESESADEMKAKVQEQYPDYSGMNYLDMTVGFFFPNK